MKSIVLLIFLWVIAGSLLAESPEIFSIRSPESTNDKRYEYDRAVLELALEKTQENYGLYRIQTAPPMNFPRAISSAEANLYPNFFIKLTYEEALNDRDLSYVLFPVDLGIVGYRVCFVSESIKDKVEAASSFMEIKKFSHGQGTGWSDTAILRRNGMKVIEVSRYENLFTMVARNRFDLFCRGANEILEEYNSHKHISGLTYDTSMAITYPFPRFFYTHKNNPRAISRIKEGLITAYKDGSLVKLWLEHYRPSITFTQLSKRRIYRIDNPNLQGLEKSYQQYFYEPLSGTEKNPGNSENTIQSH